MLKRHLKGKTCRKWANGLKLHDSETNMTTGLHLPMHVGYIPYLNMFIGIVADLRCAFTGPFILCSYLVLLGLIRFPLTEKALIRDTCTT